MQSNEADRVAITHFTSQETAARILDGWRHEVLGQSQDSEEMGHRELSLRLYSRYGMNDPNEHLHGPRKAVSRSGRQRENGSISDRLVFPDTAFIYSGSRAIEDETSDRLDLWRAYGANGEGIAITTIWSKSGLDRDGLGVLKVKYVDAAELAKNKRRAEDLQAEIDRAVDAGKIEDVCDLHKNRMELEVGYKTTDYESEEEIRIVYFAGDQSGVVPSILNCSAESGRLRTYVTRKVKIGIGQTLSGLYVTIGPRVSEHEASHWKLVADWTVRQLRLSGSRWTRQSELMYVG